VFREPGQLGDSVCPAVPPWNYQGILGYSTATGKPTRPLYQAESNCVPPSNPVELMWSSRSGDAALGYLPVHGPGPASQSVYRFGLFTAGKFTPLPAPPTITTDLAGTAW
jgi:hypothetical protein